MATIDMDPEFMVRVIETFTRVLRCADNHGLLLVESADGWFTLASRDGVPILGLSTSHRPEKVRAAYHRRQAERHIRLMERHCLTHITSRDLEPDTVSQGVAVEGYHYIFGFSSALPREMNEALLVVTALQSRQFTHSLLQDSRWKLKQNQTLKMLLRVAHWTE